MDERLIDMSVKFTEVYKANINEHKAIREMKCYSVLFPELLGQVNEDDTFVGNVGYGTGEYYIPIDVVPKKINQIGYCMHLDSFEKLKNEYPHRVKEIDGVIEFWKKESTFVKTRNTAPEHIKEYLFSYGRGEVDDNGYIRTVKVIDKPLGAGFISGSYDTRMAGATPDFDKLVKIGIPGLYEEVEEAFQKNPEKKDFYIACRMGLDLAVNSLKYLHDQVVEILEKTSSDDVRKRMERCEMALLKLQTKKPETFFEAMQLVVLFINLCRVDNYGRLDVVFGDVLAHDLDNGILTVKEAGELVFQLWKYIGTNGHIFDTRVIIGGQGRRNEENADRFAILAIEATRRLHAVMPVLTLRWTKSQNPILLEKALEAISEGCTYPTLYNDDAYVEGVMNIMHVPYEDAIKYAPLGCGEIILVGCSSGSPNTTMRFLKALEVTLHNGLDGADGKKIGIETGELEEFDTYEKLENAFIEQIKAAIEMEVQLQKWNREVAAKEVDLVMLSLLMEDCIAKGKGALDGGLKYFGANSEGFGMTNTANSLAVIKKVVYDDKKMTLRQLVDILDANYEGYEKELAEFKSVAKHGNNDDYVDEIKTRIETKTYKMADEIGTAVGFDWYTIANVNPGGITIGPEIAASADGRKCGEPMALGNSPTPGSDVEGLVPMLLSSAKTTSENGGCVTNMNLSRETIISDPEKFKQMIEAYFNVGGLQLNINCFSKGDLEKALEHPEEYPNLIVRVSGYSAKFIHLDRVTQEQIMARTLY